MKNMELLKKTIDFLPNYVFLKDTREQFIAYNNRLKTLLKIKNHIPLGEAILDKNIIDTHKSQHIEEEWIINNRKRYFLTTKTPIISAKGNVIGLIGVSVEVTSHKLEKARILKENRLLRKEKKESETYLDNVLGNLPLTLFWMNKKGRVIGCNVHQAKVFGLKSSADVIGRNIFDVSQLLGWDKGLAEKIHKYNLDVMRTAKPHIFEENVMLDGEKRIFFSNKHPIFDHNKKVIGIFGFGFDITERKRMEEKLRIAKDKAIQASKAKSEFVGMVNHELRTPLNGLIGMFDHLYKYPHSTIREKKEVLDNMKASAELLYSLVNDILDITRLEFGKFAISSTAADLKKVIHETLKSLEVLSKAKDVTFSLDYPEGLPYFFLMDANRIRQILFNLIGNAIKFTQGGRVSVTASCLKKTQTQAVIKISIQDTGIGIPEDKLKFIFGKFNQLLPSQYNNTQGAGLGLSITKALVEKFGGKIGVSSKQGEGSLFWFTLPLTYAQATVLKAAEEKQEFPAKSLQKSFATPPNILVVEDNIINQKVITFLLNDLNCKVEIADTGKKALEQFQAKPFDLVFLDFGLPDMKGDKVAEAMRDTKNSGKNKNIPIIGLTAHITEEYRRYYLLAGANDIIKKPVTTQDLDQILRTWLSPLYEESVF